MLKTKHYILIGAAFIVVILLTNILTRSYSRLEVKNARYEEQIKAKDDQVKRIQADRLIDRAQYQQVINELTSLDSILQKKLNTKQIIYERIPVAVDAFTDNELSSAIETY